METVLLYILQNRSYCRSKFYIVGIHIFDLFGSCDLDLDRMTFIYELDRYPLEIYWMCENELPTRSLSNLVTCGGHFLSRDKDGGHTTGSAIR